MRSSLLLVALALMGCSSAADDTGAATSDVSEAPSASSFYRPSPELAAVLDPIVARGALTDADYATLKPLLEALPGRASDDARAMVDVSFRLTIADGARASLAAQIERWGYCLEGAQDAAAAVASNVTEEDTDFTALCAAVKGCADQTFLLGMIDGGFVVDHPALDGRFWTNPDEIPDNGVDDDGNGYADDIHGYNINQRSGDLAKEGFFDGGGSAHGTHTAAIALRGTKNVALIGTTAQNGKLMAEAIEYLAARHTPVVSFSLGTWGEWVADVMTAIDAHPEILFVESAGNSGRELQASTTIDDNTDLAAMSRPNFMKVAAAEVDLSRQSTSNFSATLVDVAAVGPQMSAVPFDFTPSGYVFEGKTSQSAPFVANAAARVRMLAPKLSAIGVRELLVASSDARPEWKGVVAANGLVNVLRASRAAAFYTLTSDGASPADAHAKLAVPSEERAAIEKLAAALH